MTFYKWSQVAAADATADSSINWQEGQAPSSVNDSARAMMAATAKYRDDIAGAIVTGGSSTLYTLSSYQQFDTFAHMNGAMIAFTPHVTNGDTVVINVDGLGDRPLRGSPGVELKAGTIIQGTPYAATYNDVDRTWYLQGFFGNPYNVPLAAGMDYWGLAAPNSSFAFAQGQPISRATYASLFAIVGTTYGPGDGTTTFNLPDKRGRVSATREVASSRLTASFFGGNSAALGAVGGVENVSLVTGNLPPYTPSGSVNSSGSFSYNFTGINYQYGNNALYVLNADGYPSANGPQAKLISVGGSLAGNQQGGTSAPFRTVQPTIICNYIIRII